MNFRTYMPQYRQTLLLAFPVILSQVGQVVVQLVDNMMVGRLGDPDQLAAVSLGTAFFVTGMMPGMGLALGLTPIVGPLYVQGGHRTAARFFQNSLLLNLAVGVLLFGLMMGASFFFDRIGQPPRVAELTVPYFRYLAWSVIPFLLFSAFKQFMEGVGNTSIAMGITITANLLNVGLNYVFIYGHFGAPAMGAAGAGLATFLSRCVMPVLFVAVLMRKDSYRRYFRFFGTGGFSWPKITTLNKVGLPIAGQMFLEVCAFSITSVMMGWIGAVQMAANQITMSLVTFSFMVVTGISAATTIRISHESGRGDLTAVRRVAAASYHITVAYMLLVSLLLVVFRYPLIGAFTPDRAVIEVGAQLCILAAFFELSDGIQTVSVGMLRGIRDVKAPMIIAFLSYIVINLPVGYVLAFTFGMGASGLWIGFIFGLTVAAVLLSYRFRKMTAERASEPPV